MASQPQNQQSPPRFQVIRFLGKGGQGFVQLVTDTQNGQPCAVKYIDRGWSRSFYKYVSREILNHASLSLCKHPHVVEFYEVFLTPRYLVGALAVVPIAGGLQPEAAARGIVMEYVDGTNLQQYLEGNGGRLSEDVARFIFQQLMIAVDFCHKKGKVNRDIKLANVLLQLNGTALPLVKLCDFGFSKDKFDDSEPQTQIGTALFTAPEIFTNTQGQVYDAEAADVWSCGIVLFIMLFGGHPFLSFEDCTMKKHTQVMRLISNSVSGTVMWPPEAAACPVAADLIARVLVSKPSERYKISDILQHPWFLEKLPPGALVLNDAYLSMQVSQAGARQTPETIKQIVRAAVSVNLAEAPSLSTAAGAPPGTPSDTTSGGTAGDAGTGTGAGPTNGGASYEGQGANGSGAGPAEAAAALRYASAPGSAEGGWGPQGGPDGPSSSTMTQAAPLQGPGGSPLGAGGGALAPAAAVDTAGPMRPASQASVAQSNGSMHSRESMHSSMAASMVGPGGSGPGSTSGAGAGPGGGGADGPGARVGGGVPRAQPPVLLEHSLQAQHQRQAMLVAQEGPGPRPGGPGQPARPPSVPPSPPLQSASAQHLQHQFQHQLHLQPQPQGSQGMQGLSGPGAGAQGARSRPDGPMEAGAGGGAGYAPGLPPELGESVSDLQRELQRLLGEESGSQAAGSEGGAYATSGPDPATPYSQAPSPGQPGAGSPGQGTPPGAALQHRHTGPGPLVAPAGVLAPQAGAGGGQQGGGQATTGVMGMDISGNVLLDSSILMQMNLDQNLVV